MKDIPPKEVKLKKKKKEDLLLVNGNPISRFHLNSFASYQHQIEEIIRLS